MTVPPFVWIQNRPYRVVGWSADISDEEELLLRPLSPEEAEQLSQAEEALFAESHSRCKTIHGETQRLKKLNEFRRFLFQRPLSRS